MGTAFCRRWQWTLGLKLLPGHPRPHDGGGFAISATATGGHSSPSRCLSSLQDILHLGPGYWCAVNHSLSSFLRSWPKNRSLGRAGCTPPVLLYYTLSQVRQMFWPVCFLLGGRLGKMVVLKLTLIIGCLPPGLHVSCSPALIRLRLHFKIKHRQLCSRLLRDNIWNGSGEIISTMNSYHL